MAAWVKKVIEKPEGEGNQGYSGKKGIIINSEEAYLT